MVIKVKLFNVTKRNCKKETLLKLCVFSRKKRQKAGFYSKGQVIKRIPLRMKQHFTVTRVTPGNYLEVDAGLVI
jgi:hypothetical protein